MLELNSNTEVAGPEMGPKNRQPRRLLVALALLLFALAAVLVKNHEFWFGSDEEAESEATSESRPAASQAVVPTKPNQTVAAKVDNPKASVAPKTPGAPAETPKEASKQEPAKAQPPVVVSNRSTLPPLDVEVVAGNSRRTVHPGSNVEKVEILGDDSRHVSASAAGPATNAAEQERIAAAPVATTDVQQTVDSNYPLLGKHTSVQGSVVLQAVVSADGTIEELRVLSGPAILTAAAQQAVRQWRFKPVLQHGQPVETMAKIVVNFSIKVSDNAAKTS
jgi:periplasmic protein TonB